MEGLDESPHGEAHVMARFSSKDLILLDQMDESGEVCWPKKQFLGLPQSFLLWCDSQFKAD